MSIPISAIASIAFGFTDLGSVPALITSKRSPPRGRSSPSAIWLRHELAVQRNNTSGSMAYATPVVAPLISPVVIARSSRPFTYHPNACLVLLQFGDVVEARVQALQQLGMKGIPRFRQRVVLPGSLLTHLDETRSTQVGEVP